MLSNKTKQQAAAFSASWNEIFSAHSRFELDGSWVSIGTVDLLLRMFRGAKELKDTDYLILDSAASYLSTMAIFVWKNLEDPPTVRLKDDTDSTHSLILECISSDEFKQSLFSIDVAKCLAQISTDPPNPLPIAPKLSLPLSKYSPVVSHFSTGLLLGNSPLGDGPWTKALGKSLQDRLTAVIRFGAESTASTYERLFPLEEIGANWELYARGLIFPPIGISEEFPGTRGIASVIDYCKHRKFSIEQISQLFRNLSTLPDEQTALVGIAGSCAVSSENISGWLRAAVEARADAMPALRPAVILARKMLGRSNDWITDLGRGNHEHAKLTAELEYELGLMPLMILPIVQYLDDPRFRAALLGLSSTRSDSAAAMIDLTGMFAPLPAELILQQARLAIFYKNTNSAENLLLESGYDFTKDTSEIQFVYFCIQAEIALAKGQSDLCIEYLIYALETNSRDLRNWTSYGTMLATIYLSQGNIPNFQTTAQKILSRNENAFNIRLHLAALAQTSGDQELFSELLSKLTRETPSHPDVFFLLRSYLLENYDG